jgi:outer membrane lipoprotein-sorting protein
VTENGKVLAQIEFKPVDKKSEYAKIRVSINKKTNLIDSIKAFSKDGSRYTFSITRHKPQASFGAGYFKFDAAKYPRVKVEDLRM